MYIKEIYDNWDLHIDATELEIKFRFFKKLVDILNTRSLLLDINNPNKKIEDIKVISNWQSLNIQKAIEQFFLISDYRFPNTNRCHDKDLIVRSLFICQDLFIHLKVINYKASDIDAIYEPLLFYLAQEKLSIAILEEWASILSKRIKTAENFITIPYSFETDWVITFEDQYQLRNVMWLCENMLISLRETADWFNQMAKKPGSTNNMHTCINIMNHLIVFVLSEFYIKYYYELHKINQKENYYFVLSRINEAIQQKTFASSCYNSIAVLLNALILTKKITENDSMVQNFMSIIETSCSAENKVHFKKTLFNLDKSKIIGFEIKKKLSENSENLESVANTGREQVDLSQHSLAFEQYDISADDKLPDVLDEEEYEKTKILPEESKSEQISDFTIPLTSCGNTKAINNTTENQFTSDFSFLNKTDSLEEKQDNQIIDSSSIMEDE
ncbi:MAG: hypothetical protein ACRC4M_04425 [Mycoplasma sp.]